MREPAFPEAEFEQIRQQRIASYESMKSEPSSLASLDLSRHMNARYPRGDVRYTGTIDEEIEDVKKVTLDDVRQFYAQFYGVGEGEIAISGQFDPAQVEKLVTELFGDWKSASRYERIPNPYAKVEPINHKIETPDKQNAYFLAAASMKMTDEDPDLAAVTIAGMVFGGSPNSRVFQRIRVKDGLSYGASAGFSVPTKDDGRQVLRVGHRGAAEHAQSGSRLQRGTRQGAQGRLYGRRSGEGQEDVAGRARGERARRKHPSPACWWTASAGAAPWTGMRSWTRRWPR